MSEPHEQFPINPAEQSGFIPEFSAPHSRLAYTELDQAFGEGFHTFDNPVFPMEFPDQPGVSARLGIVVKSKDSPLITAMLDLYDAEGQPYNPRVDPNTNDHRNTNNSYMAFFGAEMVPFMANMRDVSDAEIRLNDDKGLGDLTNTIMYKRELTDAECRALVDAATQPVTPTLPIPEADQAA